MWRPSQRSTRYEQAIQVLELLQHLSGRDEHEADDTGPHSDITQMVHLDQDVPNTDDQNDIRLVVWTGQRQGVMS